MSNMQKIIVGICYPSHRHQNVTGNIYDTWGIKGSVELITFHDVRMAGLQRPYLFIYLFLKISNPKIHACR